MVMVVKFGQMEHDMRVTGGTTKHVVRESFGMLMGTYLKGSGKMIKQTAMVSIYT